MGVPTPTTGLARASATATSAPRQRPCDAAHTGCPSNIPQGSLIGPEIMLHGKPLDSLESHGISVSFACPQAHDRPGMFPGMRDRAGHLDSNGPTQGVSTRAGGLPGDRRAKRQEVRTLLGRERAFFRPTQASIPFLDVGYSNRSKTPYSWLLDFPVVAFRGLTRS